MLETIRNMFRRKSRTSLTVFGIVIGIFTLLVMGSMAERLNRMLDGDVKHYTGQISLAPKGSAGPVGGGVMQTAVLDKVAKLPGVKHVSPSITVMLQDQIGVADMETPTMVTGIVPGAASSNLNDAALPLKSGRDLKVGDSGVTVVGCDLAKQKGLVVGDNLMIRKHPFRVVGILDRTLAAPDKAASIALDDARVLFIESSPFLKAMSASAFSADSIVTGASVTWTKGTNPEVLAKRIERDFPDIAVSAPAAMKKQLSQAMLIFNLIVTGSALIALIVGGLSVINTMTMSVSERTSEIGLKKALGARTSDILREYLTEAGAIGLLGGLIGAALGAGFVSAINMQMAEKGAEIFLITPRLVAISLAFAAALGSVSGIYPAYRAANLDCVRALKED